ncbi:MAG: metalloregulator ArsR/SmtB family transcription factor [candidate division SR1 bacterium]|nr:metalloregulator ArsR/SmtB family transcription factor [candidate division SR1 bacterium]
MQSISDVLVLIAQPNRLQIICLLGKKGELCVCEIMEKLGLKQNLASHHLGSLRDIGLLVTRREGKNIFYALDKKVYQHLKYNIKHTFSI